MNNLKTEFSDEKSRIRFEDSLDLYFIPIWIATLSDGRTVYQDDYNDAEIGSAWIRLGNFIRESGTQIVSLCLRYRSHVEYIDSNADGYYFAKGISATIGENSVNHEYIVGSLKNGKISVARWKVPELIALDFSTRTIEESGPRLILNNGFKTNKKQTVQI